jgi:thiamine pyrophosphokinase
MRTLQRPIKKAIIIAGGDPPSLSLIRSEITAHTIIVAVDSGANCLYKYKIIPNYIIGDLDSITSRALSFFNKREVIIERFPRTKNYTDAVLAINVAASLGAKQIVCLGCLGGKRADHAFGSLGLLELCMQLKIDAAILDEANRITLHNKSITITGKPGHHFSILAYGAEVKKLSLQNSKYKLTNYDLKIGDTRTLSNEFLKKNVKISIKSGKFLLFLNRAVRPNAKRHYD